MDPNTQDQQAPATEMPKEQNAVEEKHECPCSREGHGNHGHHHCQNQGCCRRGIIKPTVISGNPSKQETRECPCAHHHDGENDHSHHHHDHHDGLGHDHSHPHDHSCEHECEHQCESDHHGEQSSEQGHENGFPPDFLEFKHFRDVFPLWPLWPLDSICPSRLFSVYARRVEETSPRLHHSPSPPKEILPRWLFHAQIGRFQRLHPWKLQVLMVCSDLTLLTH